MNLNNMNPRPFIFGTKKNDDYDSRRRRANSEEIFIFVSALAVGLAVGSALIFLVFALGWWIVDIILQIL